MTRCFLWGVGLSLGLLVTACATTPTGRSQLKLVSLRQGRELIIHAPVDDPCMPEYISALASLMTRQYKPLSRISVATINGEDAAASPYCPCFEGRFETAAGHRTLDLFQPL